MSTRALWDTETTPVQAGKQDLALWDGVANTFTRSTAEGCNLTLNKLDWMGVDVLSVYGGGTNRTDRRWNRQ